MNIWHDIAKERIKKDDFIIYQIASGNTYGLGTLVIYYQ